MSWSRRRQLSILLGITAVISVPFIIIGLIFFLNTKPTCFDGIQNGLESGVDCGGGCELVCVNEAIKPIVLWSRSFEVGQGYHNVVAYIENQNPSSGAERVPYTFQFFEGDIELEERTGFVDIKPKSLTPVIENSLYTGERKPTRMSFTLGDPVWKKVEPVTLPFFISRERVIQEGDAPRVAATIRNTSPRDIGDVTAIVFVYGPYGNLMTFSSTYIDALSAQSEKELIFTWTQPFSDVVTKIEVIPQYNQ